MSPIGDADDARCSPAYLYSELYTAHARIHELEAQLSDVLADIVDLEKENANKRHVDELLFKANERIAELERGFCTHKAEQECTYFTEGE